MAYITADKTRAIKKALTKRFPKFKFQVRNRHFTSVSVTILAGPVRFDRLVHVEEGRVCDHIDINQYHLDYYQNSNILKDMYAIINDGNHDNSDIMTDYFDVGWYVHFDAGAWDKPYILTS